MENLKKIIKKGDHDEVMAELRSSRISLDKDAVKALLKRGNHEEIMLALDKALFGGFDVDEKFMMLLKRGNHDEVMAYLRSSRISLDKDAVKALLKRGNHEEIMLALDKALFGGFDVDEKFMMLLKRGNHDEVMAYLRSSRISLDKDAVKALLKRGNHEEIKLEHEISLRRSSHESHEEEPLQALMNMDMSECTCRLSLMDAPYHLY